MRTTLLTLAALAAAFALASCADEPCGPATCPSGCCGVDGTCLSGVDDRFCGRSGEVCHGCSTFQRCLLGTCIDADPGDGSVTGSTGSTTRGSTAGSSSTGGTGTSGTSGTGSSGSRSSATSSSSGSSGRSSSSSSSTTAASSSGGRSSSASTGTSGSRGSSSGGSTTGSTGTTRFKVMFDAAHLQTAGNACWIVDETSPNPTPAVPTQETDWSGSLSTWGFELFRTGRYAITQLPPGNVVNYGAGGVGDLSQVDVFVSDEPERRFSAGEMAAMARFAQNGGGLMFIADHLGAKRCTACVEAWEVINEFLDGADGSGWGIHVAGNDVNTLDGYVSRTAPLASFLRTGRYGVTNRIRFHDGSAVTLTGTNANSALVVESARGAFVAAATLGGGRMVVIGDSSPMEDVTAAACTATVFDGWGEADHAALMMNSTGWLAGEIP